MWETTPAPGGSGEGDDGSSAGFPTSSIQNHPTDAGAGGA